MMMERPKDMKLWAVSAIIALIFSLFTISPVMADDSTPTPMPAEETPVVPALDASNDTAGSELSNLPSDPGEVAESALNLSEVLAQFQEDTIVVAAVNDHSEALATLAAGDALVVGDASLGPQGAQPIANLNGCTASYPDLYS